MNSNEIKNDKINASIIKIELLQKEYEIKLQQYQEAVQNYLSLLATDNKDYIYLNEKSWWGTSPLKEGNSKTKEECSSMCLSDSSCSGATFNPVQHYCWTRKGEGKLAVNDDDYAIITKQKNALLSMNEINTSLIVINEKINTELTNITPETVELYKEKINKQAMLTKSYNLLLVHQQDIDSNLKEYISIEETEQNNILFVNQQHMRMRIWMLVVCLLLLVTIKILFGSEGTSFSFVMWLAIIVVLTTLSYTLSSPTGFMMWFVIIMIVFLMNI